MPYTYKDSEGKEGMRLNMNKEKISYKEALALITIVIINKVILILPKEIISSTGSSAWLNVLYVSIIAILITWFITFLFKKFQGYDILDISEFLGGKWLKLITGLMYIFLFILVPLIVIRNFSEALKIIYFRDSPLVYILSFFIISSIIANMFSLKVISKVNLMLISTALFGIVIILVSSIHNFTIERIFPILGYGFKETFVNGLSNIVSFSGIGYLFVLNPFLDKTAEFKKISIISIIISAIYLFLTVICILLSVSFTFKGGEVFSLYLLVRNFRYGKFIQRVDAIFIFLWIISTIIYISFAIYITLHLIKKITKISDTHSINYTVNLLILSILLVPISLASFNNIVGKIFKISVLIGVFGISILILILANLKLKFTDKNKKAKLSNL